MKQKVSVRAIIKRNNKILLLRRAEGRETILGKYELPGGSVRFAEQPDDTLRRYITEDLQVELETLQLQDVMGYNDPDDSNVQYILIVYLATLDPNNEKMTLTRKYDRYEWRDMSEIQHDTITDTTSIILGRDTLLERSIPTQKIIDDEEKTSSSEMLIVYTDGGSRGNPGPSATGYVVLDTSNKVLDEGGGYLGITTNNQAEYQAVLLGLQRARELGAKVVDFRSDSMLIVNQMKGIYQVKNRDLWPIYERIKRLIGQFDKVSFRHVRREFNKHADSMVNKVLDQQASSTHSPNRL